eukprot:403358161
MNLQFTEQTHTQQQRPSQADTQILDHRLQEFILSESPLILATNQNHHKPNDDMWKFNDEMLVQRDIPQVRPIQHQNSGFVFNPSLTPNQQIFSTESLVLFKSPILQANQSHSSSDSKNFYSFAGTQPQISSQDIKQVKSSQNQDILSEGANEKQTQSADFNPETSQDRNAFIIIQDQNRSDIIPSLDRNMIANSQTTSIHRTQTGTGTGSAAAVSQKSSQRHLLFQPHLVQSISDKTPSKNSSSYQSVKSIQTKRSGSGSRKGTAGKDRYNPQRSSQSLVKESLEKLKLQTLSTYSDLKENQASISEIRRVQEVFSVLQSSENSQKQSSQTSQLKIKDSEVRSSIIPPPPFPIGDLMRSMTQFFSRKQAAETKFVPLQNLIRLPIIVSMNSNKSNSIFSHDQLQLEQAQIQELKTKIEANFQKKVQASKTKEQTALMKYKFNETEFLRLIVYGKIEELETEKLEMFIKILPKTAEIQKLKEVVLQEGFNDIQEALENDVKFGSVELFMIKTLEIPNLEVKSLILLDIAKFQDFTNDYLMLIENWICTFNSIKQNFLLHRAIKCTQLAIAQFYNNDQPLMSHNLPVFDILDLNQIFEIKSSKNNQKCLYDYICKQLITMSNYNHAIENLSCQEIFPDDQLNIIRSVLRDNHTVIYQRAEELSSKQKSIETNFKKWDQGDKEFWQTLQNFQTFYDESVKHLIEQSKRKFDLATQEFMEFFMISDVSLIDKAIQVFYDFHFKHQKIFEKVMQRRKAKLLKQQNQNLHLLRQVKETPEKLANHQRNQSDVQQHLISAPKKISHQRVKSGLNSGVAANNKSPMLNQVSRYMKQYDKQPSQRTDKINESAQNKNKAKGRNSPRDSNMPQLTHEDLSMSDFSNNGPKTQKKSSLSKQLFQVASKSNLKKGSPMKFESTPSIKNLRLKTQDSPTQMPFDALDNIDMLENLIAGKLKVNLNESGHSRNTGETHFQMNSAASQTKKQSIINQGGLKKEQSSFLNMAHKKVMQKENLSTYNQSPATNILSPPQASQSHKINGVNSQTNTQQYFNSQGSNSKQIPTLIGKGFSVNQQNVNVSFQGQTLPQKVSTAIGGAASKFIPHSAKSRLDQIPKDQAKF